MGFGVTRGEQSQSQGWTAWLESGYDNVLGGSCLCYSVGKRLQGAREGKGIHTPAAKGSRGSARLPRGALHERLSLLPGKQAF